MSAQRSKVNRPVQATACDPLTRSGPSPSHKGLQEDCSACAGWTPTCTDCEGEELPTSANGSMAKSFDLQRNSQKKRSNSWANRETTAPAARPCAELRGARSGSRPSASRRGWRRAENHGISATCAIGSCRSGTTGRDRRGPSPRGPPRRSAVAFLAFSWKGRPFSETRRA